MVGDQVLSARERATAELSRACLGMRQLVSGAEQGASFLFGHEAMGINN